MPEASDIAKPTISEVFDEFLKEETSNLTLSTQAKYVNIIELFTLSINGYAYQYLDPADSEKFDRLYNEEEVEFCDIFGPEHILSNLDEFLSYFMVRKVMAGKETLRAAGTVTKKLAAWLERKGYTSPSESKTASKTAAEAAKVLPQAEECAELLYEYARTVPSRGGEESEEGYFDITRVEPGKIWLESMSGENIGPVEVPEAVTDICKKGWSLSLMIARKGGKWVVVEVGNVYAM